PAGTGKSGRRPGDSTQVSHQGGVSEICSSKYYYTILVTASSALYRSTHTISQEKQLCRSTYHITSFRMRTDGPFVARAPTAPAGTRPPRTCQPVAVRRSAGRGAPAAVHIAFCARCRSNGRSARFRTGLASQPCGRAPVGEDHRVPP